MEDGRQKPDVFVTGAELPLAGRCWPGAADRLPLVLLHGLTEASGAWESVAARLAGRRRVYAWDARGHGASGWAADGAYHGDAHFADVLCALDWLGIEHCALAGFSMGGAVAILCAGALPERIARLVVVDAYPDPAMSPGSRQIAEFVAGLAGAETAAFPGRPPFDPAIARTMAAELAEGDPRRLDLWPFWEAGVQAALLVRGALSMTLSEEMAEAMLRRRPGTRLVTVPDVAHSIPALKPAALAAAIDEFLGDF